tara:strand:+ start:518 stop:940 length:423 start_codon:yes stop_codon:yes gene_type:complete
MKTSIIFLSLIFLFFSCSEPTTTDEVKENVEVNKTTGDQIPDGEFIQKYPSGAVQIKGEMSNNERVDLWTAYYENGMKQSESTYQNGVLHGRTASFYTNGQVRYIGYFLGGQKDGKWEFYTEEGKFEKSEMYLKGKLTKE